MQPHGFGSDCEGFSPAAQLKVREAVRSKYTEVSQSAAGKFAYPVGRQGAEALGYDLSFLMGCPPELFESFCGVGNPFSIAPIAVGSSVLDVGCGAGLDVIVARHLTGPAGRVCGIDLTAEMVARARANLAAAGLDRIEIIQVDSEAFPFSEASFDVVVSNGVINLSPCKKEFFAEIYRVLRLGGRLQFADIVADREIPIDMRGSLDAWAQ